MKLLSDLLNGIGLEEVVGSTHVAVAAMANDSRKVRAQGLFCAIRGEQVDGHDYLSEVSQKGVVALVVEELPEELNPKITYVRVSNSREAWAQLACAYYEHPSREIKVVGVTGTNGKTTVATLLYRLFNGMGFAAGLISTVEILLGKEIVPATHTTPDAAELQKLLRNMADRGIRYCFMEVSSHALDQGRTAGLQFAGGIFTNITHDHLDYHGSFDNYIVAKKKLFDQLPPTAFALVNRDDRHGQTMLRHCRAAHRTFGLRSVVDYHAKILDNSFEGLHLNIGGQEMHSPLMGRFNASNLLAVYAAAMELGAQPLHALTTLSTLKSAEGRFEYQRSKNQVTGVVDYAHTPDALENVLETLNDLVTDGQRILTVVGCGGDRDVAKRPEMAVIAVRWSSKVVLTSDNPRSEHPDRILEDMRTGLNPEGLAKTLSITSRREAIRTAFQLASPGDVVLVAGKGHEKYQEIMGERLPFDDMEEVRNALQQLNAQ